MLQDKFVPPLQSFPEQQGCPAELPHDTQVEEALQTSDAPQLPEQHGCPAPPHAWHRSVVALQNRFAPPVQDVPPQHGSPAAEPQMHFAGEPWQLRLPLQLPPAQHGAFLTPHVTQNEPSHARLESLQLPPAQQGALCIPQHPNISQPPHPLHVPDSLMGEVWLYLLLLFVP